MNNEILILRQKEERSNSTLGTIYFNGVRIGFTVEDAWRNNAKGISCIPAGDYNLVPHDSAKHGLTVAFVNHDLGVYHWESEIPNGAVGRSTCLIHTGNWSTDVEGCVAIGSAITNFGTDRGWGVAGSKLAFQHLQSLWGDRSNLTCRIAYEPE